MTFDPLSLSRDEAWEVAKFWLSGRYREREEKQEAIRRKALKGKSKMPKIATRTKPQPAKNAPKVTTTKVERWISLDTETTGADFYHGSRPFFVTICDEQGQQKWWEWSVGPETRLPDVPIDDLNELKGEIERADRIVLQNTKFDATALLSIMDDLEFPWRRDQVGSARPDLGIDIEPYEVRLKKEVQEARKMAGLKRYGDLFGRWRLTREGLEEMPSAKDAHWKTDMWILREMARVLDYPQERRHSLTGELIKAGHPWWTTVSDYANADSSVMLPLFRRQEKEMKERSLWKLYLERLRCIPISWDMEQFGMSYNDKRRIELMDKFQAESEEAARTCVNIAKSYGYELKLPKMGNNGSLTKFVFGYNEDIDTSKFMGYDIKPQLMFHKMLGLPIVERSETTGAPSLNEAAMKKYLESLPENSKQLNFIRSLLKKRKYDTSISYMKGYQRFAIPLATPSKTQTVAFDKWYTIHPNINQTGTNTLRFNHQNPNSANISKKEQECHVCAGEGEIRNRKCRTCEGRGVLSFNVRYIFGPRPGREWFSMDGKNLELRIPAYIAGEQAMIDLFERPNEAPYYGSNHLLVCHILHPKMFEACRNEKGEIDGRIFKKKYESTWYRWVKMGNFAITCGAIATSGTADRAFNVPGAQRVIEGRMTNITKWAKGLLRFAEKHGYVETIPDKSVDPDHGYPIMCKRSNYGGILETTPLSYCVQGTSMWWTARGMVRIDDRFAEWEDEYGFDAHIVVQEHDGMTFDLPKPDPYVSPLDELKDPVRLKDKSNLWRVKEIQKLFEMGGDGIGVPTPCSVEFHPDNWKEGHTLPI